MTVLIGNVCVNMEWRPVVSQGDALKAAKKKARESGANWYTFIEQQQTVGAATFDKSLKPARGEKWYSAGRIAGGLQPNGFHFFMLRCLDQQVWACGLKDGVPVYGYEVLGDEESCSILLREFHEKVVLPAEADFLLHSDVDRRSVDVEYVLYGWDELVASAGDDAALHALRQSVWERMPPAARYGLVAMVALMAVMQVKGYYSKVQAQKRAAELAANTVDPVAEWQKAYQTWLSTLPPVGPGVLGAWREQINHVGLELEGWRLKRVECKSAATAWSCVATYDRKERAYLDPTLEGFEKAKPAGWVAEATSLDVISAKFSMPYVGQKVDLAGLPKMDAHIVSTTSILQRFSRAYTTVTVGAFSAARIEPPRKPDGTAVEQPLDSPKVQISSFLLEGPLRSMDLKEIAQLPVAWKAVILEIKATPGASGITSSVLNFSAQGDFYAKQ